MSSSEPVFGYGSNMDLDQMKKRCPNSDLCPFIAEARGWQLCFPRTSSTRRGGVGSIVREPGESAWGVVFLMTPADLKSLDGYEGVFRDAYHREKLEVFTADTKSHIVWTYFAVPQDSPAKRYLHTVTILRYICAEPGILDCLLNIKLN